MTAVEWLIDELTDNGIRYLDLAYEIIEQAKELEKQQIQNAYDHYRCVGNFDNGIEYYNEIHKKP
jgi:hypothetical protein